MNVHEIRRYQMLRRVRDFGATERERFASIPLAVRTFTLVADAVSAVEHSAWQESHSRRDGRQHTIAKAEARRSLMNQLQVIRRTARALALDAPQLRGTFQMPRAPRDLTLVAVARAIAAHAAPLEREFIAHALPETFIADLNRLIDDFEQAIGRRHLLGGDHTQARVGIELAVARGFLAVRRLDAIVLNRLRGDVRMLAQWRSARFVERSPASARPRGRFVPAFAVPERQPIAAAEQRRPVADEPAHQPYEVPRGMRPHFAA
jgi:hypothetical protein